LQTLELFTATTIIEHGNLSAKLSINKELIQQEPFPLAVVVTYGVGGDCIIERLKFNASIDEIFSYGKVSIIHM